MKRAVAEFIKEHRLIEPGERVLCALSGGADSMCLCHVLWSLQGELSFRLYSAHFIHGLRPEAAEGELALVRRFCAALDIPLTVERGDTAAAAKELKMGTEEAARTIRYDFLERARQQLFCDKIATAHQANDNAETVLFNLVRGAGSLGLGGIPKMRGRIIRPLLDIGRAEIERYLNERGIAFAVDRTNDEAVYSRNRIRNLVLPELTRINSGAISHIVRAAKHAKEDEQALSMFAQEVFSEARVTAQRAEIDCITLRPLPPAVRYRVIRLLYGAVSAGALSAQHVEAVTALIDHDAPAKRVDLPHRICCRREYHKLVFEREGGAPPAPLELTPLPLRGRVPWGDWVIEAAPSEEEGESGGFYFSLEELSPPLIVRPRRAGDIIFCGNMHKSMKKWMIEQKIPQFMRDRMPVICDNKGILALGDIFCDPLRAINRRGKGIIEITCRRTG